MNTNFCNIPMILWFSSIVAKRLLKEQDKSSDIEQQSYIENW